MEMEKETKAGNNTGKRDGEAMEMEKETKAGNNTGKRDGEAQEQRGSSAKMLKCSIEADAFCCDICSKPLMPPIFQCTKGHFCCSECHNELPAAEEKCTHGSGCTGTLAHNLVMDRVVRSILVDCRYAEYGCTEKIAYCDRHKQYEHDKSCPHAPWRCPEPSCGFAGRRAAELLEHLTGHHKWPSMTFQYWVPFDLRVVEPGTHVLQCEGDGQLFLLSVQPAKEPAGFAVSLVSVQYLIANPNVIGCSVDVSQSGRHRNISSLGAVRPWWHFRWPPTEYICVLPKIAGGTSDDATFAWAPWGDYNVPDGTNDDAGVVLTINITAVNENDVNSDEEEVHIIPDDDDEGA